MGAVLDTTKKGSPTDTKRSMNTQGIGFDVTGGVQPSIMLTGRVEKTKKRIE